MERARVYNHNAHNIVARKRTLGADGGDNTGTLLECDRDNFWDQNFLQAID